MIVERTCTEAGAADAASPQPEPRLLSAYRECQAYVLLGPPGAGKTTAFELEAQAQGVEPVTARDFLTFDERPGWRGRTLFIDALDEVQAGQTDRRDKLDAIRRKLDRMGMPRFRISCREADWFGAADGGALAAVSPDGAITVLRLDPLSEDDSRRLLAGRVPDVDDFLEQARARGIDSLLGNPLDLDLLVEAVAGGSWPQTRLETLEAACQRLLREDNVERRQAESRSSTDEELLDAGGLLCALVAALWEGRLQPRERRSGPVASCSVNRRPQQPPQFQDGGRDKTVHGRGRQGRSSTPTDRGVSGRSVSCRTRPERSAGVALVRDGRRSRRTARDGSARPGGLGRRPLSGYPRRSCGSRCPWDNSLWRYPGLLGAGEAQTA